MEAQSQTRTIAVRLQGGIGDHLLGMRVLPFIRHRWPDHEILVYSDGCGIVPPMEIAAMSPYVSRVTPVFRVTEPQFQEAVSLKKLRPADFEMMMAADRFIDAAGEGMFLAAARVMDIPVFDILARTPALRIPEAGRTQAAALLRAHADAVLVGMHLAKYGPDTLMRHRSVILCMLQRLLEDPRAIILNLFATCYDAVAWPADFRITRERNAREEMRIIMELCDLDRRVVACADLPIATTAALVQRCSYFIGVDSGIKHLAWAFGVPHTVFLTEKPSIGQALRWIPDVHRMLLFECSDEELDSHIGSALSAIASPCSSPT